MAFPLYFKLITREVEHFLVLHMISSLNCCITSIGNGEIAYLSNLVRLNGGAPNRWRGLSSLLRTGVRNLRQGRTQPSRYLIFTKQLKTKISTSYDRRVVFEQLFSRAILKIIPFSYFTQWRLRTSVDLCFLGRTLTAKCFFFNRTIVL